MAGACSCESCFGKAAEVFEALSGACSCESCLGGLWEGSCENCLEGLREGLRDLRGLRPGKRQS